MEVKKSYILTEEEFGPLWEFINDANTKCLIQFKCDLETLLNKSYKTEEEKHGTAHRIPTYRAGENGLFYCFGFPYYLPLIWT